MDKLLLDTHILLWSLMAPERLHPHVADALENPANECWLSPITTWEIMILAEKGRIHLDQEPIAWLRSVGSDLPFKQAPLNHEVALQSRLIDLPHQDPADRFIAATAVVYDLRLVTADSALIQAAGPYTVLPNT